MSEAEFMRQVVQLARLLGWWVHHAHISRGGEAGLPDLVMVKAGRPVVYAELKTERGKVTPEQQAVLDLLRTTPSQVFLWRPTDWDEIQRVLGATT